MGREQKGKQNNNYRGGLVALKCQECKRPFQVKRGRAKTARFCSMPCANSFQQRRPYTGPRKAKVQKHCRLCKSPFSVLPSRVKKIHFCSQACQYEWRADQNAGARNPNWNGGTSKAPYPWVFQAARLEVLARDGNRCMNTSCRRTSTVLNVHHIDYDKGNCKLLNLITTCASCNARANFNRADWTAHYRETINSMRG